MKKIIIKIFLLALFSFVSLPFLTTAYAHSDLLDVEYDDCSYEILLDDIGETWYSLVLDYNESFFCSHLSHETTTIKYFFEDNGLKNTSYTWTTDVSLDTAQDIKTSFANSMKKWNNVYFYSFDSSGNIVKNKIINVIEGTRSDHNLSIYPASASEMGTTFADTNYVQDNHNADNYVSVPTDTSVNHRHGVHWYMNINLRYFYLNSGVSSEVINVVRERTGAHELGHVLGLLDVDNCCSSSSLTNHHEEILMGYGQVINRTLDITYKDIAGVSITRGFHTDNDHRWLADLSNSSLEQGYKLICSICNGVIYTLTPQNYRYDIYNECNGVHSLSSGNMMAVASYGNKDYYKCKYCRYVAPFISLVNQNYQLVSYNSSSYHKYYNYVQGLNYTTIELHNMTANGCSVCGYGHSHSYVYVWKNNTQHAKSCSCGAASFEVHAVSIKSPNLCIQCGGRVSTGIIGPSGLIVQSSEITLFSENGSFVLQNGVVVLVDSDIESYLNGTLVFQYTNMDDILFAK